MRGDLLRAANRVVEAQGVAKLTLDAVAREAGVSKGERWDEAMRLRPPSQRTYQRQAAAPEVLAAAA